MRRLERVLLWALVVYCAAMGMTQRYVVESLVEMWITYGDHAVAHHPALPDPGVF